MDIALKNVTRFKTIVYEFSKGEDYHLIRKYVGMEFTVKKKMHLVV